MQNPAAPKDSPTDLLKQNDEILFRKGGCGAFALELEAAFRLAGVKVSEIQYLQGGHEESAAHVFVKIGAGYFDSGFGPKTKEQIWSEWPKYNNQPIRPVGSPGWLTNVGELPGSCPISYLGLCVDETFLSESRRRAILFIERNWPKFEIGWKQ
jgi:hypothetical protein